jgi:alpha-N-acetylglucosamine transferase
MTKLHGLKGTYTHIVPQNHVLDWPSKYECYSFLQLLKKAFLVLIITSFILSPPTALARSTKGTDFYIETQGSSEAYVFWFTQNDPQNEYEERIYVSVKTAIFRLHEIEDMQSHNSSHSKRDIILLTIDTIHLWQIQEFEKLGAKVLIVDLLEVDAKQSPNPGYSTVYSKYYVWCLTGYDKVLFVDADFFFTDGFYNIWSEPSVSKLQTPPNKSSLSSELQHLDTYLMAAVVDPACRMYKEHKTTGPFCQVRSLDYFNSGLFMVTPLLLMYDYIIKVTNMDLVDPFYPEQEVLNYIFDLNGTLPYSQLPSVYNTAPVPEGFSAETVGLHLKYWYTS